MVLDARSRILATSYDLFAQRGVRAVGVDEVIARSAVAKSTFYRHFPSKNALVMAFLARREQQWTLAFIAAGSERRGSTPEAQLLAIFDVFDEWFASEAFDGCSFINILLEMGPDHELGLASIDYLANIREIVRERAARAGLRDPESFSRSWHILMKGSIVAAAEGDIRAAQRAKAMARSLIDQFR